jgi:hypothetical protein
MAWEWSHTAEAYEYARQQIESQFSLDDLRVILAEIAARSTEPGTVGFDVDKYESQYKELVDRTMWQDVDGLREWWLDLVWEFADEQRTCDNGGWNAWVCPFGCHTVPFGPEE